MTIEDRIVEHCHRHGLLPPGAGVLALVSGGADSTCLMHVLAHVHDGPVHVLVVDHGLRSASATEADVVVAAAEGLGLTAHRVALGLAPGPAAMERARDARLASAEEIRLREGLDLVATGHTRTDHAETVIFRIARGTGRTGALGIAPRRDALVRPLLCLSRHETRGWCVDRDIPFADDPTNEDRATARARVRHGAMPALVEVHPAAEAHLARLADLLRDEGEVLAAAADAAWDRCARGDGLGAPELASEPVALARILVRRLIVEAALPSDALGSEPVERVRARAARGRGRDQIPGGMATITRGVLRITPTSGTASVEAAA